eukprot:TRINITY_DN4980_c0_g1_i2.p1 TRINITY_DN4980_c0_g1~~TRINITY_DN4980_c0_g1_i2.p1  ORF type:complete len:273 (+),score=29.98 TRINITY_DN4980_c0_g1_i2:226-1044(+)
MRAAVWWRLVCCYASTTDGVDHVVNMSPEAYQTLLNKENEAAQQFTRDLPRTFPDCPFLQHPKRQQSLHNICQVISVYNDFGYCSGMSFIGGTLLLHMEEQNAAWAFVKLCANYGMYAFFQQHMKGLKKALFVCQKLLDRQCHRLATHLVQEGVSFDMFATRMIQLLFSYTVPRTWVPRIWDIILHRGLWAIHLFVIALLQLRTDDLLAMSFEDLIASLMQGWQADSDFVQHHSCQAVINAFIKLERKPHKCGKAAVVALEQQYDASTPANE